MSGYNATWLSFSCQCQKSQKTIVLSDCQTHLFVLDKTFPFRPTLVAKISVLYLITNPTYLLLRYF